MGDMAEYWRGAKDEDKARRARRRHEAQRRIAEISQVASKVSVRGDDYTHVTVWLSPDWKVEWWPGGAKWSTGKRGQRADGRGGFDSFKRWLEKAVASVPASHGGGV